jgi:hypothetical protein
MSTSAIVFDHYPFNNNIGYLLVNYKLVSKNKTIARFCNSNKKIDNV